jgi:putative hydrolase of the HAD superfamily
VSDAAAKPDPDRARPQRLVIAVGGLVASGKSTLARALAARLGAAHIEADLVRNAVLVRDHTGDLLAIWAPELEHEVYDELLRLGAQEIDAGRPLVLDACFPRRDEREAARELAHARGCSFAFVESRTSPEVTRARLAARDERPGPVGWREIHATLASHFEPADELDPAEHVVVRGDVPVHSALDDVLEALRRLPAPRPRAQPEVVTFDCWNTLLVEDDWRVAHALRVEALRNAAVQAGSDVDRERAGHAFDTAWQAHMQAWQEGRATGAREVAIDGLRELGLAEPQPALEHLIDHFERASHSGRVRPLDTARETLAALCAAGIRCALICDTGLTPGRVVRQHLDRLGMLEHLSLQVFSDEVGVPKPDPRTFRAALEPFGVSAARALHVGDLRRTDVGGAHAVGMASVRIRASHDDRSELPEADYVVDSHAELRALLHCD